MSKIDLEHSIAEPFYYMLTNTLILNYIDRLYIFLK
jgi:hypothetical protein